MTFNVTIKKPVMVRRNYERVTSTALYELGHFTDPVAFMDFVREHRAELEYAVAVSPRNSTEVTCNEFLKSQVGKVETI